jgi:hypothetical protein
MSGGKSGRLYYRGICEAPNSDVISFPSIKLKSPQETKSALLEVQEMFQDDKDISVTEEPLGIIRVKGSGLSGEILQTKISSLRLKQDAQYDPAAAIRLLLSTKEMQSTMRQWGTRPAITMGGLERMPSKGMPHLDQSMENVTLDQAMPRQNAIWCKLS